MKQFKNKFLHFQSIKYLKTFRENFISKKNHFISTSKRTQKNK